MQDPGTLVCFSHLRWDFVFQRPQHLMTRFARGRRVIYVEEPVGHDGPDAWLETRVAEPSGVTVAVPFLPWPVLDGEGREEALRGLMDGLLADAAGPRVFWFYTPMLLPWVRHIPSAATVYDCMDELSAFRFAPPELVELEAELLARADVVFTGGYSLYEAKRGAHPNVHPFPSSVDVAHFARARAGLPEPEDQAGLPTPRLGFYGVVDERMDLGLLHHLAQARPDWSIVVLGPVVKIGEDELPRLPNLHYPGGRPYDELPDWLAGWDVALMPFAVNEHTRFISPTKTPEYLAGGRPVVSTPIVDVERQYGALEGVRIAPTPERFVAECEAALALARGTDRAWLERADAMLRRTSWDETFAAMATLVDDAIDGTTSARTGTRARSGGSSGGAVHAASGHAHPAAERAAASPTLMPSLRRAGTRKPFDVLVAGAGFAGAVLAERLAAGSNKRVLVIDRRPHIAGNAYDHHDAAGILVHKYGPHIFHTNSEDVFAYLSRFTRWRPYEHRVLADIAGRLLPVPINRTTLNRLYGLDLPDEAAAEAFLAGRAEPVAHIRTSEDVVVSKVGRELYELFFRGYTRKQWGLDPSELDKSVTARVPTRTSTDDRYFTDRFQAMPADGYTAMFAAMLDHPNIEVELGVEFDDVRRETVAEHTVFTGPIDEYFDFRHGKLPYRSLHFRHETHDVAQFQPVAVVNYPDAAVPHTRITEYKHLTGQVHRRTSLTYEVPAAEGDPYYPIPRPENQALFRKYEALAAKTHDVTFVGRLATYRYYNMDQVVGQALATYRRMGETGLGRPHAPASGVQPAAQLGS